MILSLVSLLCSIAALVAIVLLRRELHKSREATKRILELVTIGGAARSTLQQLHAEARYLGHEVMDELDRLAKLP
jgi:hypothetical protein